MEIEKTLFVTNGKITLGDTIFIGGKPYLDREKWENPPRHGLLLFLQITTVGHISFTFAILQRPGRTHRGLSQLK